MRSQQTKATKAAVISVLLIVVFGVWFGGASLLIQTVDAVPEINSANMSVIVNGKNIEFGNNGVLMIKNTTLVPFRIIFQHLGAKVSWDSKSQTITAKNSDITMKLFVGKDYTEINGRKVAMNEAPLMYNGVAYIPIRFVSEHFDAKVIWNAKEQKITIANETGPQYGWLAPEFELTSRDGKVFNLATTNKPTYIFFWASWCPYCKEQFAQIEQLYKEYGDKVNFVTINIFYEDTEKAVNKTIEDYNITFPIYYSENQQLSQSYKRQGVPSHHFITKDGIIHNSIAGSYGDNTYQYHKEYIEELLSN